MRSVLLARGGAGLRRGVPHQRTHPSGRHQARRPEAIVPLRARGERGELGQAQVLPDVRRRTGDGQGLATMRILAAIVLLVGVGIAVYAGMTILAQQAAGAQPWGTELSDNIIFARTIPFVLALGVAAGWFGGLM